MPAIFGESPARLFALFAVLLIAVPVCAILIRAALPLGGAVFMWFLSVFVPQVFAPIALWLMHRNPVASHRWELPHKVVAAFVYAACVILMWVIGVNVLANWPVFTLLLLPLAHLPVLLYWYKDTSVLTKRVMVYNQNMRRMMFSSKGQREYYRDVPKLRFGVQIAAHLAAAVFIVFKAGGTLGMRVSELSFPLVVQTTKDVLSATSAAWLWFKTPLAALGFALIPTAIVSMILFAIVRRNVLAAYAFMIKEVRVEAAWKTPYFFPSIIAWIVLLAVPAFVAKTYKAGIEHATHQELPILADMHQVAVVLTFLVWLYLVLGKHFYWRERLLYFALQRHIVIVSASALVVLIAVWFDAPTRVVDLFANRTGAASSVQQKSPTQESHLPKRSP